MAPRAGSVQLCERSPVAIHILKKALRLIDRCNLGRVSGGDDDFALAIRIHALGQIPGNLSRNDAGPLPLLSGRAVAALKFNKLAADGKVEAAGEAQTLCEVANLTGARFLQARECSPWERESTPCPHHRRRSHSGSLPNPQFHLS